MPIRPLDLAVLALTGLLAAPVLVGSGSVVGPGEAVAGRPHSPARPATVARKCATSRETGREDRVSLECMGLVYVWSPSMPLSRLGIEEARRTASALDVAITVVSRDELLDRGAAMIDPSLRFGLVGAGATIHFPSLTLVADGRALGNALLGYKRADAYQALLTRRLSEAALVREAPAAPLETRAGGRLEHEVESGLLAAGTPQEIEILWRHEIRPPPGAFFRRVPGTSFITFDQDERVYLHDPTTGESFRGPGWIDFVPSPDGRLFVTPGRRSSGLEFYDAGEVIERGRSGQAEEVEPVFTDAGMTDQYPSVGILETDARGRATRYRVLMSWFSGLAFRDYDVSWEADEPVRITPRGPELTGCPGRELSTPILGKDGRELAARDEGSGTTRIYRLSDNGSCREVLDLGVQTSKVGFGPEGRRIAYSSPDLDRSGRSNTYVFDRSNGIVTRVPYTSSQGLVIPEFVGPDSLLVAVRDAERGRSAEFRLLCCVD